SVPSATRDRAWRCVVPDRRGEHHARIVERPRNALGAGLIVDREGARPGPAAVGGAKHSALIRLFADVPPGRDKDEAGILGIDEERGDVLGVRESRQMLPGLSSIGGLVHAVALVDRPALHEIAGPALT